MMATLSIFSFLPPPMPPQFYSLSSSIKENLMESANDKKEMPKVVVTLKGFGPRIILGDDFMISSGGELTVTQSGSVRAMFASGEWQSAEREGQS
jgi:hypothetical protein